MWMDVGWNYIFGRYLTNKKEVTFFSPLTFLYFVASLNFLCNTASRMSEFKSGQHAYGQMIFISVRVTELPNIPLVSLYLPKSMGGAVYCEVCFQLYVKMSLSVSNTPLKCIDD